MAYSFSYDNINTYTTLEDFRSYYGIHPFDFYDWSAQNCIDDIEYNACADITTFPFSLNAGVISLEEIGQALQKAENLIEEVLDIPLGIKTITETINLPYFWDKSYKLTQYQAYITELQTRLSNVRSFGSLVTTQHSAAATVVYTDNDGDGISETGTIVVAGVTVDNVEYIQVRNDGRRIEPLRSVEYDEDTDTITIEVDSYLMKRDDIRFNRSFSITNRTDICDIDNFIDEVEVLELKLEDGCSDGVYFVWSNGKNPGCENGPCEEEVEPACAVLSNCGENRFKIFPAAINETTGCHEGNMSICWDNCLPPDKVRITYNVQSCLNLSCNTVIALASAECLPERYCSVSCFGSTLSKLQDNVLGNSVTAQANSRYRYPNQMVIDSFFGTTVGAIQASRDVERILNTFDAQQCCDY